MDGSDITSTDNGNTPDGSRGLVAVFIDGAFSELLADVAGEATDVSIDLGDFAKDADLLVIDAYNSSSVLVDSASLLLPSTFTGMETLSVSAPDIAYVIFDARAGWGR